LSTFWAPPPATRDAMVEGEAALVDEAMIFHGGGRTECD
jgi:hypothetical protein